VLQLQRLTRRVGDLVALDGLSFTLAEGQRFGFVGPNGAGKTTAMRIVLGVLESDAGQVRWFRPMTDRMSKCVGHMAQDHGQTFSTQCARTSRGSSGASSVSSTSRRITGMSRSGLRQRPSSGVYRVSAGRHDAGRRDACRSLWRVTLTAPVRFESRRMWLVAYNTNLTPLVTGPVIQLSQRHARSVATDELGLLM
jgi:ABC-type branched-subunit amino acid transport system ATPase component